MNKRGILSEVLDRSGIIERSMCSRDRASLSILAYHRIAEYPPDAGFDFDDGLISATPDAFDAQIRWLKRHFNIITFRELDTKRIEPNTLLITFDDGYRDNYTNAYPVLRKHGIAATLFLATGHIGTGEMFWWDTIAYAVKKTKRDRVVLDIGGWAKEFRLSTTAERKELIRFLLGYVKEIPDDERKECIAELTEESGVDMSGLAGSGMILDWDHIKEMSASGMEFGAHSVSHPVLAHLSEDEKKKEIEDSKRHIESRIDQEVIAFSYPVGGYNRFDQSTRRMVEQAGYRYAVTYVHGSNDISSVDKMCLKRMHVEKEDTLAVFESKIAFPELIRY